MWLVNIVFKMVGKWVYYCPQTCGKIGALSWLSPSKPLEIFLAFLWGQLLRYVGTLYPYKIILSTIHKSLCMQLVLHFKWELCMICILLQQFDWIIFEGVIALFNSEYFIKSLFLQLLLQFVLIWELDFMAGICLILALQICYYWCGCPYFFW